MRDRRRRAGGVQAEKQQRDVQLIAQGVNNSEACRLVGIDRKTGTRWRYGRRVRNSAGALVIYAPVKINEARPRSPRYLSEQERIQIADLLAAKRSLRGIAEQRAGHAVTAEEDYAMVLTLYPTNKFARFDLGVMEQEAGRIDQAISLYQSALKDDANFSPAKNNLEYIMRTHFGFATLHQR